MGKDVTGWVAAEWPGVAPLEGRYARLDRLEADAHAGDLFTAFAGHDGLWDYMPYGPFHSLLLAPLGCPRQQLQSVRGVLWLLD